MSRLVPSALNLFVLFTLVLGAEWASAGELDDPLPISDSQVEAALREIEGSTDPCGESAEVAALVAGVRSCRQARFRIRVDATAERNVFERPSGARPGQLRTIIWNPELRSEIEPSCEGDFTRPVKRDPVASLLHELVHAKQDCEGLDPRDHELEAVRIENIYRRARGLCQRTRYGDTPLPANFACQLPQCQCRPPIIEVDTRTAPALHAADAAQAGR